VKLITFTNSIEFQTHKVVKLHLRKWFIFWRWSIPSWTGPGFHNPKDQGTNSPWL